MNRWLATLVGVVIGLVSIHQAAHGSNVDIARLVLAVRVAAVALCLGAAFALDDPAAEMVASAPAAAPFQRALRVAVFLPGLVFAWSVELAYANAAGEPLPLGSLTLEFGAMVAVTWAASAVATPRVPEGLGGVAAGPALLGFVGAGAFLRPIALFLGEPGNAAWTAAHRRWIWVLMIALAALVQASRDPGRARHGRLAMRAISRRRRQPPQLGDGAQHERFANGPRSAPRSPRAGRVPTKGRSTGP